MIAVKCGCDRSKDVAVATDFSLLNTHNFFVTVAAAAAEVRRVRR